MTLLESSLAGFAVCWGLVVLAVLLRIERHTGDIAWIVRGIARAERRQRGER